MKDSGALTLVVIFGAAGSGKTSVAKLLHEKLPGGAYIGVDQIKRFIFGFRDNADFDQISRKVVIAMTVEYLSCGLGVIVEQGMRRDELDAFKLVAADCGAVFSVYRLDVPFDVGRERANRRQVEANKPCISDDELSRMYRIYEMNNYNVSSAFESLHITPSAIANEIVSNICVRVENAQGLSHRNTK